MMATDGQEDLTVEKDPKANAAVNTTLRSKCTLINVYKYSNTLFTGWTEVFLLKLTKDGSTNSKR